MTTPSEVDLAYSPAYRLAEMVRNGEVRSADLVDLYLDRIERHNGALNAVVTLDPEGARRTARECDRAVAEGREVGPLHGVPITVKDAFTVAGMRSTSGMTDLADDVPDYDAFAVGRLRGAGAVILGKTNCPPGVTGQETANEVFGRTNNPWDLSRTCGGSSGGAAVALAAGLTALELGSDSGGSIRQPAHYCGVYGHAPTHGLVPLLGHRPSVGPDQPGKDIDLLYVGPMARCAEDLELALGVIASPDPVTGTGWALDLAPARVEDVRSLRVGVWADDPACPTGPEVAAVLESAADALESAGASVDRAARPSFPLAEAQEVAFALWVAASSERTGDEEMDRLRQVAARGGDSLEVRRAVAETMPHRDWLRTDSRRRRMQTAWLELLDRVDVVVCPVTPVPALPHDPEHDQIASVDHRIARTMDVGGEPRPYLDQLTWPIVVGMAGLPATVVPLGLTPDGLPVGAQVVGKPGEDRRTLAAARMVAEVTGGFRRPPGYG